VLTLAFPPRYNQAMDVVVVYTVPINTPLSVGPASGMGWRSTAQVMEIMSLKAMLEDEGVPAMLRPDPELQPNGNIIGGVSVFDLLVNKEDESRAKELIAGYLEAEPIVE
jgi:hypothetical protein